MPPLEGATEWLNSEPLGTERLRGQVVLVDFWTFTCINWLRTQPYIRAWSQVYRDDGLVVVGVHTPEFAFEHEIDLIRRAVQARGIDYPIAVDSDYKIWTAFDNHYWPAQYYIDRDGLIRVACLNGLKAAPLDDLDCIHSDQDFVLYNKYNRSRASFLLHLFDLFLLGGRLAGAAIAKTVGYPTLLKKANTASGG